ncbi:MULTISPECIES: polyketide synthase [unclassified Streptomyces]|uniref:beta-ketoacyl [acyl carrier protein] synthase domain-containing protein n=1 Tax=unclassified Streptomyces TaxID=2593676 RepID=UPI001162D8D1|nr:MULTISPECIES: polyketide synthase [unclassified Streptomyces]QDN62945.1 polyketide synthase [Streptomyces sp. S1D4-20]QDN72995.1 polyketide synthase [Streptomyces sp. S1D4-14]QDO55513.1 polyketide synthase [Streptomyces sp. RLB3-5]QDO55594.1 polyketide synthase [Streptomyces sp. RLB3-5]QDO57139.1 polyketide synthase [Streptomyces sp. RLB1-8]
MDTREILTRFKGGTLRREHAVALLAGTSPVVAPPVVALPVAALPAADREPLPTPGPGPTPGPAPGPGPGAGAGDGPGAGAGMPCAVVGIQGRFPQAGDLEAFWRNGLQGRIAEAALPGGRRSACAGWRGHFLDGVEEFDPDLFGLGAREAAGLDLRERLLAQSAWQTLESAGYAGARLERLTAPDGTARSVGVYAALGPAGGALPGTGHRHTAPPASRPGPAARLSRLLDLRGPSLSVDSGDSSFLTALHLALGALRAGECAAALVGAVELRLHPACQRPGAGEGVAAVLLKPLAAARADGDRVHAVIRSSAVGHPGRAAPGPQHGRLVGRALAAAGLRPPGTGPQHPDAGPQGPDAGPQSEAPDAGLEAVGVALQESSRTVAALVGDAGAVTGAAALVRAVGQLRHAVLLAGPDRPAPAAWEPARSDDGTVLPRRALVSVPGPAAPASSTDAVDAVGPADAVDAADTADGTDGVDGTDGGEGVGVVLVVEEAPAVPRAPARTGPPPGTGPAELVLLSAATPAHLAATAGRLAARLSDDGGGGGRDGGPAGPDLAAVAHELRLGRAVLRCRLAVTVRTVAELADALAGFAAHPGPGTGPAGVRSADLRTAAGPPLIEGLEETRAYVAALWQGGRLEQLTRLWLAGADVCAVLPAHPGPAAVELPATVLRPRPLEPGPGPGTDGAPQ